MISDMLCRSLEQKLGGLRGKAGCMTKICAEKILAELLGIELQV